MENQIRSKKDFFAEWLEKLQQESWQLELLISGLALYGIYASADLILSIEYYLEVNELNILGSFLSREISNAFIGLLWTSRTIFLINLLLHIVVRGFWIGAIGLRYVSGDIDYEELNYSDRFTNYYKKKIGSFDAYIERLENFSSILFSFTFLLFFLLFSFFIFNLVFFIVSYVLSSTIDLFAFKKDQTDLSIGPQILLFIFYYLFGILVLVDFLSLGSLKKISDKTVGGIYFWIYRFYSAISLSFLYRPILLNFLDNKYTKRLFILAVPYCFGLLLVGGFKMERHEFMPSFNQNESSYKAMSENIVNYVYYDDLRNEYVETLGSLGQRKRKQKIDKISLSQYEVDQSELKVFLEYSKYDTELIKNSEDSLTAYRERGLYHRFQTNKVNDKGLQAIIARELEDVKLSYKTGTSDSIDRILISRYGDFEGDTDELQERIIDSYENEKYDYIKQKSSKIKTSFQNLHAISLNNVPITENLECKYYIHPNMLEKGLLCYINIDTIGYGSHTLSFSRGVNKLNLPFRKIKQNQ